MSFRKLFLPQSDYARNVYTMMTGTSLAQVIPLLAALLLTRIYDPFEFGLFNMIASLSAILGGVISGRYELAVMLPREQEKARQVGQLSIFLSLVNSFVLFAVVAAFGKPIAGWLGEPAIEPWLYAIPLMVFLNGVYQTYIHFVNRGKAYKTLATAKITDGVVNNSFRVGYGWLSPSVLGLVAGTILGQVMGIVLLWRKTHRQNFFRLSLPNLSKMKAIARKYYNFPLHMVPSQFLNVSAQQSPHFLLTALYSAEISGFFGLTFRVVKLPVAAIAAAFTDVFKQQAAEEYRNEGHFRNVFYKTLRKLVLIATVPFAAFYFLAPELFALVFSDEWRMSGVYAQIFTIPIYLNFIVSPLTSIYFISGRTTAYMLLQLLNFLFVVAAFVLSDLFFQDAKQTIMLMAGAYSLNYLLILVMMINLTRPRYDQDPMEREAEEKEGDGQ